MSLLESLIIVDGHIIFTELIYSLLRLLRTRFLGYETRCGLFYSPRGRSQQCSGRWTKMRG